MKKQILNLGKALSKAKQKTIVGGMGLGDPCPCTTNFRDEGGRNECSYPSLLQDIFPGSRCYGEEVGGICCES